MTRSPPLNSVGFLDQEGLDFSNVVQGVQTQARIGQALEGLAQVGLDRQVGIKPFAVGVRRLPSLTQNCSSSRLASTLLGSYGAGLHRQHW